MAQLLRIKPLPVCPTFQRNNSKPYLNAGRVVHNCNFIQIFSVLSPKPANGTVQEVGKKRMGMVLDNVTKSQTKLEINFGSPYEVQCDLLVVRKMTQLFF